MWFTLAVLQDQISARPDRMAAFEGVINTRVWQTLKLYKIGVRLDMVNKIRISFTDGQSEASKPGESATK